MPIEEHSLEVGKLYATTAGQVRRVTAIAGGQVTYETLGSTAPTTADVQSRDTTTLATFAASVDRETEGPSIEKGTPSQAEGEDKAGT